MHSSPRRESSSLRSISWFLLLAILTCSGVCFETRCEAQLTSEHKRDLSALRREVTKAGSLVRRKEFDEAEKALNEAQSKLDEIVKDSGLQAQDRAFFSVTRALEVQRGLLAKAQGGTKGGGVSFAKDVAPILSDRCIGCHDDSASGGLRLDTFAGMRRGGRSGPLLAPGAPQRSLIALRLIAQPPQRMPRNGNALTAEQIKTVTDWISQGAKYDGNNENQMVADLAAASEMADKPKITVAKPDGSETVSFTKDVAPMLVNFCHGCHSGNNPDSGFSVETFEKILIGGDSGEVLIPGELEDSRLFRLTGGLENPRMPQGQARITRKNYEDLKAWIVEGIKYDGDDPKTPLLDIVPSADEIRMQELAQKSEAEMKEHRIEVGEQHWRRTLTSANPEQVSDDNLLVMGNVEKARLIEVLGWADELREPTAKIIGRNQAPKYRGRLAIYVFKDRYDYDEFNRSVENRQPAKGLFGHAKVTPSDEMAYLALLDTGDVVRPTQPTLKQTLAKSLISAYLQQGATARVEWLSEGAGWAFLPVSERNAEFEKTMTIDAIQVMTDVRQPADLFRAGTFAPDLTERVGFVVARFLVSRGTGAQFDQFQKQLHRGQDINQAAQAVYKLNAAELAQAVLAQIR